MKIFYDTEFIDDGNTIEPISFGFVSEDGDEYYAVNGQLNLHRLWTPDNWLVENVVPSLPIRQCNRIFMWDDSSSQYQHVASIAAIREGVADFFRSKGEVELWAWYGAYDFVVLVQLWGLMKNMPNYIPRYYNDLRQEIFQREKLGDKGLHYKLPPQQHGLHHALADAKHLKLRYDWVMARGIPLFGKA